MEKNKLQSKYPRLCVDYKIIENNSLNYSSKEKEEDIFFCIYNNYSINNSIHFSMIEN